MAKRARLDLTRSGRVLNTAGFNHDGRTMYVMELDHGGQVSGPGPEGLERGSRAVLRRYQLAAPPGSVVRVPVPWLSVDAEGAEPTLPPEGQA